MSNVPVTRLRSEIVGYNLESPTHLFHFVTMSGTFLCFGELPV